MTHPTGIVAPHPAIATSSAHVTHTTNPQTTASLAPATPTSCTGNTVHDKSQAMLQTLTPHKSHCSKTVIIQDSMSDSSSDSDD